MSTYFKTRGMKADLIKVGDTRTLTRDEWLDLRRTGIGGSDIGSITGCGFSSPVTLWREKRGVQTEGEIFASQEFGESEKAEFGHRMEEVAADAFAARTGFKVENCYQMLRDPVHHWKLANVDRIYHDGQSWGVLELKNIEHTGSADWVPGWYGHGGNAPKKYVEQVCWYADILGLKKACLVAVIRGCRLVSVEIPEEVVRETADRIHAAGEAFWDSVVSGDMPNLSGSEKDLEALSERPTEGLYEYIPDEVAEKLIERIHEAKAVLKAAEADYDALKVEVSTLMGGPDSARKALAGLGGAKIAEYRESSRKTTDTKALLAKFPQVYAECVTEKPIKSLYITAK